VSGALQSAFLEGTVEHRRLAPRAHAFRYHLGLFALDVAELPTLFRGRLFFGHEARRLASFRRADYLGPRELALDEAVRARVESELGRRPAGPITLVTQLRFLGYVFNPVSFYVCHDARGELDALVAEITNTPWGERHAYVLDAAGGRRAWRFPKRFHVSPFLPMELEYDWRLALDERGLAVHMTDLEGGRPVFHARLELARRPLDGRALARALVRHAFQPQRVSLAIYTQAALLWAKRTPFFTHPAKRGTESHAPRTLIR
jgi:hypothetical protein